MLEKRITIFYTFLNFRNYTLFFTATPKGLCYISSQALNEEEGVEQLEKYIDKFSLEKNDHLMQPYKNQLIEYFEGKRRQFDIPLDLYGTPFQQLVWKSLLEIPYGETTTYQDIGNKIGKTTAVRAIGNAIGKNPLLIVIPCHRVIRKNGDLGGFREGLDLKRTLLELERKVNNSSQ